MKRYCILVVSAFGLGIVVSLGGNAIRSAAAQTGLFPVNGVATWCYSAGAWTGCPNR